MITLLCIIFSCDPGGCTEYVIENKTDRDLKLIKYSKDSLDIKNQVTEIFADNSYTEMYDCSLGKGVLGYRYDSIQIITNGILSKTYYPDDDGKSIFKTTDLLDGKKVISSWKLVNHKERYGRHEKYVFEITEEDLK